MTYPTNPSFDTRILGFATKTLWRITSALLSKTEELNDRFDWSIRTDLDDEADELRAVIADCNKAKAQAEARLTEVLDYLDPDDFYGGLTPRPQVPEGAGLAPAADPTPVDEDDAPQGYRAVAFNLGEAGCSKCAFVATECPSMVDEDGPFWCDSDARDDRREVLFIKRD